MSFRRLKGNAELHLWLSRIIDDLDPTDFSANELFSEFGATDVKPEERLTYNTEGYIRAQVARLLADEHIEKIAKGRYQVTDSGQAFRDKFYPS